LASRLAPGSWLPRVPSLDLTIYVDASSIPNPGPSGVGLLVLARSAGQDWLYGWVRNIGFAGNNQAEFQGLMQAVELVRSAKPRRALIVSDSTVALRLLTGAIKASGAEGRVSQQRTCAWLHGATNVQVCWAPRGRNLAHHLAQTAARLPHGSEHISQLGQHLQPLRAAS